MSVALCSYFSSGVCRSCGHLSVPYPAQLKRKEDTLKRLLEGWGHLPLDPTVGSEPLGFRDRAKLAVTGTALHPVIGLLGEADLDHGRELTGCPIHHPRLNEVLAALPTLIRTSELIPYRVRERQGELKGLILFRSPRSQEMYLRFVLRSKASLSRIRASVPELQRRFPDLTCVSANIQPIPHAILEGPEEVILSERGAIRHRLAAWDFQLAPQAFVQTHSLLAEKLYATAADWVAQERPQRALDLYCGQGAFSVFAHAAAGSWHGVEVNGAAVLSANESAARAGLKNLRYSCADAREIDSVWQQEDPELVLVNPPRAGIREGRKLFERFQPKLWIYSSCNAETLAEDIQWAQGRYSLERAQIFDFFPHTDHFETLVLLKRRSD